ncbi:MAG: ABC transporter substrate-binding protein [Nocardioides sp.]|uniref:ABC transporter substrate-binding protein n=1 Tax=Nocardioides sp. TaxID=35761 RepID=UPI0039E669A8
MHRILRLPLSAAALLLASSTLVACGGSDGDPLSSGSDGGSSSSSDTITIGSANFPESELLADIYAGALKAAGVKVETKLNIGSREVYYQAFEDGSINLLPEYNGALLAYLMPDGTPEGVSSTETVDAQLAKVLPEGSEILDSAEAQDVDTITVTKETADKYDLTTIADLKPVAGKLTIGGPPEWKTRQQGLLGLKSIYGVEFGTFKSLDAGGPLTIEALKNGDIDAADVFSTDSSIVANDWVSLEDTESLFLAENVVPFIKSDVATDEVKEALNAVSAALTTEKLAAAVAEVQVDKKDPVTVAAEFLSDNDLD